MKGQQKRTTLLLLLGAAVVLTGACTSGHMITIASEPSGAEILANEKPIGKTPRTIVPDEVFPPRWIGGSYLVRGNLALQKEGCRKFGMEVNDTVLSKDIRVTMDCDGTAQQPAAAAAGPARSSTDQDVEQRLQKLKALYDKGVITGQEYRDQRQRILDAI